MSMTNDAKVALFDMDGTLADYSGKMHQSLDALRSPGEPNAIEWWNRKYPWLQARAELIKKQPSWWADLPRIVAGWRVLELAQSIGFKIQILTKGPLQTPSAWSEKLVWCQKHLGPDVDLTITQTKASYYGRVLVDDWPDYMMPWLEKRPRGLGLMPRTIYNEHLKHPNLIFYDNSKPSSLDHIRAALEIAFERGAGGPLRI